MKKSIALFFVLSISQMFGQAFGDIVFTAFNADGEDDFAIVALADIPANTTIYYTDGEPNSAGTGKLSTSEGTLIWNTGGSIISEGTIVVFTDVDLESNTSFGVSVGTLLDHSSDGGFNIAADGETIYATIGDPTTSSVTVWLAAINNDDVYDTNFNSTGLSVGTTCVQMSMANHDGGKYTGARTGETYMNDYLSIIGNPVNWITNSSDGEALLPISTESFTSTSLSVVKNEIINFSLFPNPIKEGRFVIKTSNNDPKKIQIYSLLGQEVYQNYVKSNELIDVSHLNQGFYLVRVEENGKIATRKLIVN